MEKKLQGSSVSGFIQRADKKFLIIRRAEDDTFPNLWELPGGGIDYGENPKTSAKREVFEETGLNVEISYPLHVHTYFVNEEQKKHTMDVTFHCKLVDESQQVRLSFEHSKYAWITFADLSKYPLTPLTGTNLLELEQHILIKK